MRSSSSFVHGLIDVVVVEAVQQYRFYYQSSLIIEDMNGNVYKANIHKKISITTRMGDEYLYCIPFLSAEAPQLVVDSTP